MVINNSKQRQKGKQQKDIGEKNLFAGIKKVHMIGIGGIGMSGIAEYLVLKGFEVSGSDMSLSYVTRRLKNLGIKIIEGHSADNIPDEVELVIYTSAIKEDNPELLKAQALKKKLVKRAEALGVIVNDKFVISVSGTHGKTTTTAMIAKVLIENRVDPTVFLGGSSDFLKDGSSRIGKSNVAVVEADEYDRSFLQLRSDIIIITNIDEDHLDIYKDIEDIKANFRIFIENAKPNVQLIACGDDSNTVQTLKNFKNKTLYGFKKTNDYVIEDVNYEKNSVHFVLNNEHLMTSLQGKHNILNAAGAYLTSKHFQITDDDFNESMKDFYGVKRRLELKMGNSIRVYDDYAHHPSEIKATLEALGRIAKGRLITIFQPHLYSRTRDFSEEFGEALSKTDELILTDIYPAREKKIEGVTSELILNAFKKYNPNAKLISDKEKLIDELEHTVKEGDVIVFQGAGDITESCDRFVKLMKSKSSSSIPL